jgi:D-inositol-3-phosphate glycosyltransferase
MQPGSGDAGGMNVVERAQAEALGKLGHHVELITRRNSPSDPDVSDLAPNVTLRHLTAGPTTPLPKSVIDQHIAEFAQGLAALGEYDLVHSHHWMSGVAALPLAHERGIPHVQSFHSVAALPGRSLHEGEPPESPARVPGEALVAQQSDAVVAISAAEARTVIERCGADPDKVSIVSPGVDREIFRPLAPGETRYGDWERGYVLFAARLQPLKGPDLAISAIAEVPREIRPHLVVAGDTSADFADYSAKLHDLVDCLGLGNDVTFLPPQSRADLAMLMRGARVVLVPSHSETFGLVALEAAASGTPVIAAAAGGLREAVAHAETGQLMDSRNAEDWGKALRRLLTEPGLLRRMGVVARVHARRFDWDFAASRLETLYTGLING